MKTTKKVKLKQGPADKKSKLAYVDSVLSAKEQQIDDYLRNPQQRSKELADFSEEDDPIDNLRHSAAGMITSTAIKEKIRPFQAPIPNLADAITRNILGFIGSNALGVAHEVANPNMDQKGTEEKKFTKATIREGVEDAFNNFVGATVSSLPFSREGKVEALEKLSFNNLLPDGYGKVENKKGNMYFTKEEQPEQRIMPGDNVEGFNKGGKVKATKKSKLKVRKGYVDGGDIDPATLPQDVYSDYLKAATEADRQVIVANYKASQSPAPIINTAQSVVNNVAPVIPSRATGVGTPNVTPQSTKRSGPTFAESNAYAGAAAAGLDAIPRTDPYATDNTTAAGQIGDTAADAIGVGGFTKLGDAAGDLVVSATNKSDSSFVRGLGYQTKGSMSPWDEWKTTFSNYGKEPVGTSIGKTALNLLAPGFSSIWSGFDNEAKVAAAEKAKFANTVDNKKVQNDVNYVSRSGDRRSTGRNVDTGDSTASMATGGTVQESGIIKGKGTGTSDDVPMDTTAGNFIVTAKNKDRFIKEVYRPYFGKPPIAKKTGGNVPIAASNGEFMVDAEKAKFLRAKGVDLDSYADADIGSYGMKNGGRVGYRTGKTVAPMDDSYYVLYPDGKVEWWNSKENADKWAANDNGRILDLKNADDFEIARQSDEDEYARWVKSEEAELATLKPGTPEHTKVAEEIKKHQGYLKKEQALKGSVKSTTKTTPTISNPVIAASSQVIANPGDDYEIVHIRTKAGDRDVVFKKDLPRYEARHQGHRILDPSNADDAKLIEATNSSLGKDKNYIAMKETEKAGKDLGIVDDDPWGFLGPATPATATAQTSPLAKAPVTKIGAQGNTGIANPVLQIGAPATVPTGTPVINAGTPVTTPKITPSVNLAQQQQVIVDKAKGPQGGITVPAGGPVINTGVTPAPYSVASGTGITPAMTPLINAPTATTPAVEPPKSNNGTLTYALAGLQGALGIANAISNKKPEMEDTSAYEHRLQKAMADNTGLSEEEKKKFTDGATRAASTLARYGAGITGNSSEAFGMAGRALGGLSDKMLDMNVADQQLKRQNVERGDRAANSLLDLTKFKHSLEREDYLANAATSAQMIDSSISNVIGNEQYLAALDRYDKRQSTWR